MKEYAGIHILKTPFHIDSAFDYFIPPELRGSVEVGDFAVIPFGNSNKHEIGLVVSLKDTPDKEGQECKPVLSVCDKTMSLNDEMLGLCFFMKEQTLCTVGDAARAIIPASVLTKLSEVYRISDNDADKDLNKLDASTLLVCDFIRTKGSVGFDLLRDQFGQSVRANLKKLLDAGMIIRDHSLRNTSEKLENYYSLNIDPRNALNIATQNDSSTKLRSEAHKRILLFFCDRYGEEIPEKELLLSCEATKAQLAALCSKELVKKLQRQSDRSIVAPRITLPKKKLVLNEEQTSAFEKLKELSDSGLPKAALLHGVTGSGKTSVMMKTIDHVLSKGRSVIVLLPEIALTPQSLEIFCSRYGNRVAIIHSGLSEGERFDAFKRIKNGGADVVIGTRSAVFSPLENLGMIIIDEEQEHTYKSDMSPKYHTKDIARYRCASHNALMLLASATPSFESYHKASEGVYTLIKLKNRYGNAKLPKATIVDMRGESQMGNTSPLSSSLAKKLIEVKSKQEQSILFLNRRGYNNFISCRSCGKAVTCPTCSVSMTYHTFKGSYDKGELRCHWCGRRMPLPSECPECQSPHLARMGYGTQRMEQELTELMPDARILRMDTDTTSAKNSYEKILGSFRDRDADLLLGTQMVTKGHDFPAVTLVGVLLADTSLYLDDYRAAERTFAMLTQVIGRAGRADKEGEAVIQTCNPDNECIRLACAQDFESFYKNEIRLRKALSFPPFCDIALLTVSSHDENELIRASAILSKTVMELVKQEYNDIPIVTFGPFEAPVYKVENRFRMRMVIKCKLNKRSRSMFAKVLSIFSKEQGKNISLSIDFNPSNL